MPTQITKNPKSTIGILLLNIGTPDAPTAASVRRYLAQFLADKRIIEWPRWIWLPILYGIVLVFRPRRSANLYKNIWTKDGSPILSTIKEQARLLEKKLADFIIMPVQVEVGMRYGNPSIATGLKKLKEAGARRILLIPLFPQYSSTTIASALEGVFEEFKSWRWVPQVRTVTGYHDNEYFITAIANSIAEQWRENKKPEKLIFSFHGTPLSCRTDGDPYFEQCLATARLVAAKLSLDKKDWMVTFQSRFGPEEWLTPYTDITLGELARSGIKSVGVVCPCFSADCLETIDEINREGRQIFDEAGGETFHYYPALNIRPDNIEALSRIAWQNLQGWD